MLDLVLGMAKRVSTPSMASKRRVAVGICAVLAAITWLVFGQTLGHQFVTYDDPQYVYENAKISAGLSLEGVSWAFTHTIAGNWHPLTTVSHMFDCQLYGLKPAGHHFTNVLLHTIAVILLFLVLRQMTGTLWRSAFVAALFAIHPLHVESVAWISERKDVLSAVFFILTLGAYIRYVSKPSVTSYLLVVLLFACGLMSKPMLVTVPFVLLLLDHWPLGRGRGMEISDERSEVRRERSVVRRRWSVVRGLVVEKIPLLALSAASCLATLLGQRQAAGSIDQLPFAWRVNNAIVTCVAYIWQMLWPVKLAVFYPHPDNRLLLWQIFLALALLIAITVAVIASRQKRPYLMTGWLWYLGMLVPVIGLVQVGEQARADRYTYLPQVGLYLALTWTIVDLSASWRRRREILGVAAAVVITARTWRAWIQASYWKNSETLWTHTLAVASDYHVVHNNLV